MKCALKEDTFMRMPTEKLSQFSFKRYSVDSGVVRNRLKDSFDRVMSVAYE